MKDKIYPLKDRLKYALEYRHMRPVDLCDKTNISQSTMSQYLSGYAEPKKERLAKIANALNVEPTWLMGIGDMGPKECDEWDSDSDKLISYFTQSNIFTNLITSIDWSLEQCIDNEGFTNGYKLKKDGIEITISDDEYSELMSSSKNFLEKNLQDLVKKKIDPFYKPETFKEFVIMDAVPYYGRIASAGTGQYVFDDIPPEMIELEKDTNNTQVDFAIGVNGDSMEPTYRDGDTVLIKKQDKINKGEIGIFMINGEAYVKEFKGDKLHSHNSNYVDIILNENMDIRCIGKVIGKKEIK